MHVHSGFYAAPQPGGCSKEINLKVYGDRDANFLNSTSC